MNSTDRGEVFEYRNNICEFLRSKNSVSTSSRKGAVRRPWQRGEGIPREKEIKMYMQNRFENIHTNLQVCEFLRSKNPVSTSSRKGAVRRIQAMDFSKIGTRDFFNEKEFVSRMGSLSTWSGTISSLGGSVVSGGLGMMNLGEEIH